MQARILILVVVLLLATGVVFSFLTDSPKHLSKSNRPPTKVPAKNTAQGNNDKRLKEIGRSAILFCKNKGYSTDVCFLLDMSLPSGKKRFFIYDLKHKQVLNSGLVAHGSCNSTFAITPGFSNQPNCGCSSVGKYKVSNQYQGRFGTAYKLQGLDSTNSNAFNRFIVLHAYGCVLDEEIYPAPICNSLGCPMVSYKFLDVLQQVIKKQPKPILLWMFN
jgi:hypothetical protein